LKFTDNSPLRTGVDDSACKIIVGLFLQLIDSNRDVVNVFLVEFSEFEIAGLRFCDYIPPGI
jgi:hypothetical protein